MAEGVKRYADKGNLETLFKKVSGNFMRKTGNKAENINGSKSFVRARVSHTPEETDDVTNKEYVDSAVQTADIEEIDNLFN